jgi:hypothetical protein
MNLVRTLNSLGREVNSKWPRINRGGCCVYAALVGRELLDRGYPVTGVTASFCQYNNSVEQARTNLKKKNPRRRRPPTATMWQGERVDFGHVVLKLRVRGESRHYDSNGVAPVRKRSWVCL